MFVDGSLYVPHVRQQPPVYRSAMTGFHLWNLELRAGRLILWKPSGTRAVRVADLLLALETRFECHTLEFEESGDAGYAELSEIEQVQ